MESNVAGGFQSTNIAVFLEACRAVRRVQRDAAGCSSHNNSLVHEM